MEITAKNAAGSGAAAISPPQRGTQDKQAAPAKKTAEEKQVSGLPVISDSDIKAALEKVNSKIAKVSSSLKFQYRQESQQLIVKIVDNESGEVIKQYPPEEFLDMMDRISDFIGLILDEKA
jgi:flagellar protein FlaG